MSDLKSNKSLQFIVGAGVLYVAYIVLIREGWLAWMLSDPEEAEAFGDSSQLLLAIVSACVSFTQLIGLLTIGVVCNVLPHASAFMDFVGKQLRALIEKLKSGADKNKEDWDWRPLAAVVLGYVLWTGGQAQDIWSLLKDALAPRIENAESKPEFLIFSSDSGSATDGQLSVVNSLLIQNALEQKGIERRSYDSEQQAKNAEPWVSQAMQAAPDDESSMVLIYPNGKATIEEIPASIREMREVLSEW